MINTPRHRYVGTHGMVRTKSSRKSHCLTLDLHGAGLLPTLQHDAAEPVTSQHAKKKTYMWLPTTLSTRHYKPAIAQFLWLRVELESCVANCGGGVEAAILSSIALGAAQPE